MATSLIAILAVANSLRSVDGENTEYDRALVELSASLMPGDADTARELAEYIILEKPFDMPRPKSIAGPPPVAEPVPMTRHANREASVG